MDLRVSVLGAGSWGTTVASVVARNAATTIWARRADSADEINQNRTNARYLPDAELPADLKATADLEEAVSGADLVVMGVPSSGFRSVLADVGNYIRPWVPVVSLTKGLEIGTHYRMSEVIEDVLPDHPRGVLTGPNLAREIMAGYAAATVLAMSNQDFTRRLQPVFHHGLFRCYTNEDVAGSELGGALKNVIAIATGMGDGAGAGDNTRSMVITRGLAELTRLGVAMGGQPASFAGLAGMGDLIATCTSKLSRNRHVGEELGKGRTIQEIIDEMHMVAEGVKSSKVVMELAEKHDIEMPIASEVYKVCHEGSTARDAFRGLLRMETGSEADPG